MKVVKILVASVMLLCGALFANAQPGGQQFDPEQMVKMRVDYMKESLKLNNDQVTKLTTFFKKQNEEMMKNMQSGAQPDMEAFQKMRDAENAELKKILTEDQYKSYQEAMQQMMQGGPGGQRGPGGRVPREGIQQRNRQ